MTKTKKTQQTKNASIRNSINDGQGTSKTVSKSKEIVRQPQSASTSSNPGGSSQHTLQRTRKSPRTRHDPDFGASTQDVNLLLQPPGPAPSNRRRNIQQALQRMVMSPRPKNTPRNPVYSDSNSSASRSFNSASSPGSSPNAGTRVPRLVDELLDGIHGEETQFQYFMRQQKKYFQKNDEIMNRLEDLRINLLQFRENNGREMTITREILEDHQAKFRVIQEDIQQIKQAILNGGQIPAQQRQGKQVSYICGGEHRHRLEFELKLETFENQTWFFCPRCNKLYDNEASLRVHIRTSGKRCPCKCQQQA